LCLALCIAGAKNTVSLAQVNTAITPTTGPGDLGTTITQSGNLYDITGGTRPGNGTNLFHSFGEFGVPTNNIANFLNETALPTTNILGRVTGGNISNIFGTIQTTDFGNVNLFLINPAGFLFGPNATVNVGGMVAFTSADYLKLTDGGRFNANLHALPSDFITAEPIAAFGFLGSNPGSITVHGSLLSVTPRQSISLVGGDITVQSGLIEDGITVQPAQLSASGGQITLVSVASPGEILAGTLNQAPTVNGQSFEHLGTIHISEKSVLDVSGDGGGTIRIRGGNFIIEDSIISANVIGPGPITNGVESIGGGIDIQVSQDAVIQNLAVLETNVVGNATSDVQYGSVHVEAEHIEIAGVLDFELFPFTGIRSSVLSGSAGGNSGNVTLEANSILMRDLALVDTLTDGAGHAGNIILRTNHNLVIDNVGLIESISSFASGNAGNIELTSSHGSILMRSPFVTSQTIESSGNAGNISVNAPEGDVLLADQGSLFNAARGTGLLGGIQITANNLQIINESGISGDNVTTQVPGNITLTLSGSLILNGNSLIQTNAQQSAPAADLTITAHDILLTDGALLSTGTFGSGNGGTLNIFTQHLELTNGAQITSSSVGNPVPPPNRPLEVPSGDGGTVTVQGLASPAESVLIDGAGSGIFTTTEGTGAGGNTTILAQSVIITNGGTISASTSGTTTSATGGSLAISSVQFTTLGNGASVSASSTGTGNAGNIEINAGQRFIATDSSVTTEATQAGGGAIKITTDPSGTVQLTNSTISASVLDGAGGGGSVDIDPQFVILLNSQILAQAVQGPGGNITITITNGGLFLPDATSTISASSQFGVNGTVTIQSPNAPGSGKIQPLGKTPLEATSLLNQHCAALAGGEFSSFTVAGRNSLPTEPSSWLASPLAMLGTGTREGGLSGLSALSGLSSLSGVSGVVRAGLAAHQIDQTDQIDKTDQSLLSLRQIAPAGFLTQAFAVDWSAGCQS